MIKLSRKSYWLIICAFLCSNVILHGAIVIQGDSDVQGESFKQPLSVYAQDPIGGFFYVGAKDAGAESYAIAFLPQGEGKFINLAPKTARINGMQDQENPLHNAAIGHMTLLSENYRPVVVPDGEYKNRAFFIDSFSNLEKIEMLATAPLQAPVSGGDVGSIVGLAAENNTRGGYAFAATTNNSDDPFGAAGSGIALLAAHFVDVGEGDQKSSRFLFTQIGLAALFDSTIDQVKIGGPLSNFVDAVDMYWDNYLGRLYIALQLQAGNDSSDGVKSLVVGRIENNQLVFENIGPNDIFSGTNKIVGAIGQATQVSLHKVRTMLTSTSLSYVIVLGGNGAPGDTKRSVYALPLVNDPQTTSAHGTLANKGAFPEDRFGQEYPYRFISRGFRTPATAAAEAVTSGDTLAKVGGGLLQWDINDIFVKDDAVFAVVSDGSYPGIYYSRALFDQYGCIKSWTNWQRASGSVHDPMFGAALEHSSANILYLTGNDAGSIKMVKHTGWGSGDDDGLRALNNVLGAAFPRDRGGITGLFDMPLSTPGLDDISLLIATGCQTVALAQTSTSNGEVTPIVGDTFETNKVEFPNGIIDQTIPDTTRLLIISGGDLNKIGFIRAAEIGVGSSQAWLFVGGDCGLAILEPGWDTPPGLGSGFAGLQKDAAFKLIGSYRHIRKLLYDDGFLYVLTDCKLDRIDLNASNFSTGELVVTTVASPNSIAGLGTQSSFFDVVISEKFALLATSCGLFRIENGMDIRSVAGAGSWQPVSIPDGCGPVIQLFTISQTGRIQDVARYAGGNVYALVAFIGKNRAQVNRFAIAEVGEAVSDNTIKPLPDVFVKDSLSYFVSFGLFRDWIVSDGSLFFHEINRFLCENPTIQVLWSKARSGVRFLADKNPALPFNFDNTCFLLPLLRNSATGSWLLAGNDGLRINE